MCLAGHPGAVVSLAAVPGRPGMLASLGRDGTVRFWDVISRQRLATVPAEATAMVQTCPITSSCKPRDTEISLIVDTQKSLSMT